jgi:hypothetical protein
VAYVARHWTVQPDNTSTYVLYADNQIIFVHMGIAQAGGATSITLQTSASAVDDIYNGQSIRILSGTGDDQIRTIVDYNGTTKVATIDRAWVTNPDTTSYYGTLMTGESYVAVIAADAIADIQNGLATQASVNDLPTNAELTAGLASADDATLAAIAALNNISSAQVTAAVPTAVQNAAAVLSAATANPIDANVQEVNDVTIVGDGDATPWGPA